MATPIINEPLSLPIVYSNGVSVINYSSIFIDPDGGELTYTFLGMPSGYIHVTPNELWYAINPSPQVSTITITATDSLGNSTAHDVTITVLEFIEGDIPPTILKNTVTADGLSIKVDFRYAVADYSGDLNSLFTISYNGVILAPLSTTMAVDNLSVTLTLANPIAQGQSIKVIYDNQEETYSSILATNGVAELISPTESVSINLSTISTGVPIDLTNSVVSEDGLTVTLTFNQTVTSSDTNSFPVNILRGSSISPHYNTEVNDNIVTVNMVSPITYGQSIRIELSPTELGVETDYILNEDNNKSFSTILDLTLNNSTVNHLATYIAIQQRNIYDTDPEGVGLGYLYSNDYDTLDTTNFVYTLVSGPGDNYNDNFIIKEGRYLHCLHPSTLPVGTLTIRVNLNDTIDDFEYVVSFVCKVASDHYLPLNGGSLTSLARSPRPLKSTLLRSKVAVVYNSNGNFPDSLRIAEYYVKKRGLDPTLLYPYDFGPTLLSAWNTADRSSGDAFDMVTNFSVWCLANKVRGVVVSINTPERLTFSNDTTNISFVTMLGASHWATERGMLFHGYEGTPGESAAVETSIDRLGGNRSGSSSPSFAAGAMPSYFFDGSVTQVGDNPQAALGTGNNRAYIPQLHDLSRAESPFTDDGLLMLPSGRLGIPSGRGWVDNYDNTKRVIDDALYSERRGWKNNKSLQINGNHKHRVQNMTGTVTGILASQLNQAGWNVKGTVLASNTSGYLAGNTFSNEYDSYSLKDLYIAFNVPHTDYDPYELKAGTITPPMPNFLSFGNMLTNDGSDVGDWWESFYWETGSWHMIETSNPGSTLQRAMTAGATGGIAGSIEPYANNVEFYPGVMWAAIGGLSLMEGYWFAMQENPTASFYVAGDPLYCPYKRAGKTHSSVSNTVSAGVRSTTETGVSRGILSY